MTWVSVALIVLVVLFLVERGRNRRLRRENRRLIERVTQSERAAHPPADTIQDEGLEAKELIELRERVQVLERIATDEHSSEARKAQQIAREIESLRSDIAQRSSKAKEDVSE